MRCDISSLDNAARHAAIISEALALSHDAEMHLAHIELTVAALRRFMPPCHEIYATRRARLFSICFI